jgi:hypothetical protein
LITGVDFEAQRKAADVLLAPVQDRITPAGDEIERIVLDWIKTHPTEIRDMAMDTLQRDAGAVVREFTEVIEHLSDDAYRENLTERYLWTKLWGPLDGIGADEYHRALKSVDAAIHNLSRLAKRLAAGSQTAAVA